MHELFWTTAQLHAKGLSRRAIEGRVDNGLLLPVRKGLWADPSAPDALIRAARTGGAATVTAGAEALGLWTPPDDRLQIAVPAGASRLRDPDDGSKPLDGDDMVCVHWTKRVPGVHTLPDRVAPLLLLLEHAIRCLRPELAVAVIDSALHQRLLLLQRDLAALAMALPAHLRPVVLLADGRADSGLESIVRVLLQAAGFDVVVHAVLDGIGEVDLLVNGVLIIETDGRRYHLEKAFFRDRDRDRTAMIGRYRVLRLHQWQVLEEWSECLRAVHAALA